MSIHACTYKRTLQITTRYANDAPVANIRRAKSRLVEKLVASIKTRISYLRIEAALASSTQRTTIVNNKFRASHSVYNSRLNRRRGDSRGRFTTAVVIIKDRARGTVEAKNIVTLFWRRRRRTNSKSSCRNYTSAESRRWFSHVSQAVIG